MSVDVGELFETLFTAGANAFKEGWAQVKDFAHTEFKAIAAGLADIAEQVAMFKLGQGGYDLATGRMLTRMKLNQAEAAIAGATALTLVAVASALNAVFDAVKAAFGQLAELITPF